MPVYRFRVTFEDHEDLVRDIEIKPTQNLEDLFLAILGSVKFDTNREATFATCNDHWRKENNIDRKDFPSRKLVQMVEDPHQKLLLEFDTDRPWTLYVELFRIVPGQENGDYPRCVKEVGVAPPQYRIQPTDPDLIEDEEDEVTETGVSPDTELYRDPDDFEATGMDEEDTPEGEEDTGEEEFGDESAFSQGGGEEDY